ncbi:MAG: cupredoxin domain-containing protein [Patescibacteria group bacterium]|jgi:plastocyanin
MKKIKILLTVASIPLLLAGCGSVATPPAANTNTPAANANANTNIAPKQVEVSITNFSFQPQTIEINAGDTVQWTNSDQTAHAVTIDNRIDTGDIDPGKTAKIKFNDKETINYHCRLHPSMTGTVIVK